MITLIIRDSEKQNTQKVMLTYHNLPKVMITYHNGLLIDFPDFPRIGLLESIPTLSHMSASQNSVCTALITALGLIPGQKVR